MALNPRFASKDKIMAQIKSESLKQGIKMLYERIVDSIGRCFMDVNPKLGGNLPVLITTMGVPGRCDARSATEYQTLFPSQPHSKLILWSEATAAALARFEEFTVGEEELLAVVDVGQGSIVLKPF